MTRNFRCHQDKLSGIVQGRVFSVLPCPCPSWIFSCHSPDGTDQSEERSLCSMLSCSPWIEISIKCLFDKNHKTYQWACPEKVLQRTPSSARNILQVRSFDDENIRPAPPHFTEVTEAVCPASTFTHVPKTVSHILMSLSWPALASLRHSGLTW